MQASKIFEEKAFYNKWLKELTDSEKELVLGMMEEYLTQFKSGMVTMMQNGVSLHSGRCQCTALSNVTFLENKCHCTDCGGMVEGIQMNPTT